MVDIQKGSNQIKVSALIGQQQVSWRRIKQREGIRKCQGEVGGVTYKRVVGEIHTKKVTSEQRIEGGEIVLNS